MEDLAPLLAKAGLPSDFDALAAIKLAKKSPVAPVACPRPVVGSPPARYRLVTSVTSDNSPVDAAHEAGMAAGLLKCFLQGNTDLDKDPVVRMAFTAGVRLAELKAILNSQPPIKAKPRSPFFAVAQKAWGNCLARKKTGGRPPQDKELITEMIALGMIENGDFFELASGKNRIQRIKTRSLLNNFTRWRPFFTKWPES